MKQLVSGFIIIMAGLFISGCQSDSCDSCPPGHECYYGVCVQSVNWCPQNDPNIEREVIYDNEGNPEKVIYICKDGYYCACRSQDCNELYCAPVSDNNQ